MTPEQLQRIERECQSSYDFNGGEDVRDLLEALRAERAAREQIQAVLTRTGEALFQAERERDTALAQRDDARRRYYTEAQTRIAAESALASARELLEDCWVDRHGLRTHVCERIRAWLSSHPAPAPVAAESQADWRIAMQARIATLERELAAALKEKQRLENVINETIADYNSRVDVHAAELAEAKRKESLAREGTRIMRESCDALERELAAARESGNQAALCFQTEKLELLAQRKALTAAIDAAVEYLRTTTELDADLMGRRVLAMLTLGAAQKAGG